MMRTAGHTSPPVVTSRLLVLWSPATADPQERHAAPSPFSTLTPEARQELSDLYRRWRTE